MLQVCGCVCHAVCGAVVLFHWCPAETRTPQSRTMGVSTGAKWSTANWRTQPQGAPKKTTPWDTCSGQTSSILPGHHSSIGTLLSILPVEILTRICCMLRLQNILDTLPPIIEAERRVLKDFPFGGRRCPLPSLLERGYM